MGSGLALAISQASHFLQPPPHQSIIIERMHSGKSFCNICNNIVSPEKVLFRLVHTENVFYYRPSFHNLENQCKILTLCFSRLFRSGARRFVTLDFGRPVLLTDALIPTCGDLASLSIDIWTLGEEVDGRRLVVATDISTHSLILHDLLPPPVCRFMKVRRMADLMFLVLHFFIGLSQWCILVCCLQFSDNCDWTLWQHQCSG